MWLIITIFIVMISSNVSCSANSLKICSSEDAKKAEELAGVATNWGDLYDLYRNYHQCDDGAIAEGFSESVTILLSRSWDQVDKLNYIVQKDNNFGLFVLKHIDETVPEGRIHEIADSATNRCASNAKILCAKILTRIKELN